MLLAFKIKLAAGLRGGSCRSARGGAAGAGSRAPDAGLARSPGAGRTAARLGALSRRRRLHPRRQAGGGAAGDGRLRAAAGDHEASGHFGADYQRCVDDGACRALDRGVAIAADRPAVQVSWRDADAYAAWLSRKTGESYRLPTDEEWAFAAGSRFRDDGLPVDDNDPSKALARPLRARGRPRGVRPTAARGRSAASAPTKTACRMSAAMSGNGPHLLRPHARSMSRRDRVGESAIAACASSRASTAPMSRTSSATPAPADARSASRRQSRLSPGASSAIGGPACSALWGARFPLPA